jgi:hypothetical protein
MGDTGIEGDFSREEGFKLGHFVSVRFDGAGCRWTKAKGQRIL